MKLTNEQIEFMLSDVNFLDSMLLTITGAEMKEKLSEILLLRKRCAALEMQVDGQARYIKQLEQDLKAVINEESDGIDGVV